MKRNKLLTLIIATSIVFTMAGCTNKAVKLSEEKKIEILNEIKVYQVDSDKTIGALRDLIDQNISNYNEDERDIMVNKYVTELYSTAGALNEILSTVGYDLEEVVKTYNVDVNKKKDYDRIPDTNATVRGFLEELHAKGFSLERVDETSPYTIGINTIELSDKYSSKVSKSLSMFLNFNAYETKSGDFVNEEKRSIDLDEVAKRIVMAEDGLNADKKQGYQYTADWISALNYYYSILVGSSHDYFVSTDYLKDDVFNKYKELAEKYKDKQLGKILNEVVTYYTKGAKKADSNSLKEVLDIVEKEVMTEEVKTVLDAQSESLSIEQIEGTEAE